MYKMFKKLKKFLPKVKMLKVYALGRLRPKAYTKKHFRKNIFLNFLFFKSFLFFLKC